MWSGSVLGLGKFLGKISFFLLYLLMRPLKSEVFGCRCTFLQVFDGLLQQLIEPFANIRPLGRHIYYPMSLCAPSITAVGPTWTTMSAHNLWSFRLDSADFSNDLRLGIPCLYVPFHCSIQPSKSSMTSSLSSSQPLTRRKEEIRGGETFQQECRSLSDKGFSERRLTDMVQTKIREKF